MNNINKIKKLTEQSSLFYGLRLASLRNILVKKPEEIASGLSITVNTIKNIEAGKNTLIENINELIFFYGYTLGEFYSLKELPKWEQLYNKMEKFHTSIRSDAHKIIYNKPRLIDLIEYRLLESYLFKTWVSEKEVLEFCLKSYNYEYTQGTNALNNAVSKGWLIKDEDSKPMKYKKK